MMNPIWGKIAGAITVLLMLIFIGIWVWAWRKRHRSSFQQMAELPMEDKPDGAAEPRSPNESSPNEAPPNERLPDNKDDRR